MELRYFLIQVFFFWFGIAHTSAHLGCSGGEKWLFIIQQMVRMMITGGITTDWCFIFFVACCALYFVRSDRCARNQVTMSESVVPEVERDIRCLSSPSHVAYTYDTTFRSDLKSLKRDSCSFSPDTAICEHHWSWSKLVRVGSISWRMPSAARMYL